MRPLKPIGQQVVVITGASSGIGRDAALAFGGRGARVVLAARDAAALAEVAEQIRAVGGEALDVPTDVSKWDDVQALAERAVEAYGGIDTWINNAAIAAYGTFEQMTVEEFRRIIDVNFFGQAHGARAALPHLRRRGAGALIFVGSALSDRAIPLQSAYCAAKHAIKSLSESIRVELEHAGSEVQVTLVKPSSINTPFFDYAYTRTGFKPRPVAPVYDVGVVTDVLLRCAEHRERDVCAGGFAKALTTLETFAGPLIDRYLARSGFRGQMTDERKGPGDTNNMWRPVEGARSTDGSHPGRRFSLYTWLRLHPRVYWSGAAGLAVLRMARAFRHDGAA